LILYYSIIKQFDYKNVQGLGIGIGSYVAAAGFLGQSLSTASQFKHAGCMMCLVQHDQTACFRAQHKELLRLLVTGTAQPNSRFHSSA